MTDPSEVCPSNWTLHSSPVRGCGRHQFSDFSCDSVFFPLNGLRYYSVCGRVLGYQKGTTEAFWNSVSAGRTSIESSYVTGVSLTHGSVGSRQHIWTFAAAVCEQDPDYYRTDLNCAYTNTNGHIISFLHS